MGTRIKKLATSLALAGGVFAASSASAFDLTGIGFVQFGDAQSYSLPISNLQVGEANNPGSTFYVNSTPGAIQDLIVVATGSSGSGVTTNFAGMDDAYATPTGKNGATFFQTGGVVSPDPNGAGEFTGDQANTWDTTLDALQNFLGGESMVFFFNNNQVNSGATTNQNLAAWAQVTITDDLGNIIATFDFTNNGGQYAIVSEGGGGVFMGDVTSYTSTGAGPTGDASGTPTDYVLSGGAICLDTDTTPPTPVSCSNALADTGPINHNLGANQAAYAMTAPELDALLVTLFGSGADLTQYAMHIDLRMGCDPALFSGDACIGKSLNNGYEQLFIGTATTITNVPEPNIAALFGVGVLALVGLSRRRRC
jgi:hypothetical protein